MGASFDTPEDNAAWHAEEGFTFELWSDLDRVLAMTYGAAESATQSTASRVTVILDAEGEWLLTYDPASAASNPQDVLEDCEILFGD